VTDDLAHVMALFDRAEARGSEALAA